MKPTIVRASWRYLSRHPWQLLLSVLGVSIGVAVIIAVDLANASARKSFLMSMDAVTGPTTHQIIGGSQGVADSVYSGLRREHGFTRIAPVVTGEALLNDQPFELLGVDLFAEQGMDRFTSGFDGGDQLFSDWLVVPGAFAVAARTATSLGLARGDTIRVVVSGREVDAILVAIVDTGESTALDNFLVADIATAQEWLATSGFLSRVDVRAKDPDLAKAIESALPAGVRMLSAEGRTQSTLDLSSAFMTNLQAMSLLALLVAIFLIYNAVSFSILQRRQLIGNLRVLGATRREVLVLVLTESACIGIVASLLGLVLGMLLGQELLSLVSRSINDLYFRVNATDVSLDPFTLAKGLTAGILTSLLASFVPALEASSFQPRMALVRSDIERRTMTVLPWLTALGMLLMVAAAIVLQFSGRNLVAGLTAVFMLIFGFALCVPIAARWIANALAAVGGHFGGALARHAIRGISVSLSRTAVAIVALTVAVSATIGVSVMVDSFRQSVSEWLDTALKADIYVGAERGVIDPAVIDAIVALPDVSNVSTSQRIRLESETGMLRVQAVDMAPGAYAGTELLDSDAATVWPLWESTDSVLISEPFAYKRQIAQGDSLDIPTDFGVRSFEVLARFQSYDVNASGVMMSRATFNRHFADRGIESLGLYLADAGRTDAVIVSIGALSNTENLVVTSNTDVRTRSLEVFDQTFVITDVLYILAVVVAVIGILSSMLALQLEQAKEQGVLRALGTTPWQMTGVIELQTGVIGLISGLAAIPLGTAMAIVLIEVINRRAFGWQINVFLSWPVVLQAIALSVVAALIAGLYPSYRASLASPAAAMREE